MRATESFAIPERAECDFSLTGKEEDVMKSKPVLLTRILIAIVTLFVTFEETKGNTVDVYFTHPYGGIHKRDANGQVSTVLSNVGRCTGLEFDDNGNLYFGKFYDANHKIDLIRMSPDQQVSNLGNIIEVGSVTLSFSIDLAIGDTGDVYFTHPYGGIHKIDSSGQISTLLSDVGEVTSIEFDANKNLYFSELYDYNHKIDLLSMSPDQQVTNLGNIIEVGGVGLSFDIDLAVNKIGEVYFTHPYGGIHKMDTGGHVITVLPNIGRCTGLEFDGYGNLYFGMFYDDRHKIDLMRMSPEQQLTNLGNIVNVGAVTLRWDADIAVIPEPATILLVGFGFLALVRRPQNSF
jgi:hypothetical protein